MKIEFEDLFEFKTKEDKLKHEAAIISFRFISVIEAEMDNQGINRASLAKKLGTSKSYLTQLWRGDKVLNMSFLAKVQDVLNIKFKIK